MNLFGAHKCKAVHELGSVHHRWTTTRRNVVWPQGKGLRNWFDNHFHRCLKEAILQGGPLPVKNGVITSIGRGYNYPSYLVAIYFRPFMSVFWLIYNWFSGIIIFCQPRVPRPTQRVVDWAASGCSHFQIASPESWTSTPTTETKACNHSLAQNRNNKKKW